jgi:hypothetical protein
MFKKLNIKTLAGLFIGLLIFVIAVNLYQKSKGDRTFTSEIITADTASISTVIIGAQERSKDVKLVKASDGWKVESDGKSYTADANMINGMLKTIADLKPERIAATDKEKWKQFEVDDSLGFHVWLKVKDKEVADLVIGKFSFQQQTRKMTSFVRLADEKIVYAVDGFLRMTFQRTPDNYKNKTVINSMKSNWTKLKISCPGDSSFVLEKQKEKWMISGMPTDSVAVDTYFNSIASVDCADFVTESEINKSNPIVYSLVIEGNNMQQIEVKAMPSNQPEMMIITSTQNKDSYFGGPRSNVFNKIFINRNKLLSKTKPVLNGM